MSCKNYWSMIYDARVLKKESKCSKITIGITCRVFFSLLPLSTFNLILEFIMNLHYVVFIMHYLFYFLIKIVILSFFFRHLRALLVCQFLILYPLSLLVYLWSNYAISTWLLAVSAFSIEVIVKVIVSLLIYSLFLIDAYCSTFWEKLDDYVYYIRAFGNTVSFQRFKLYLFLYIYFCLFIFDLFIFIQLVKNINLCFNTN